MESTTDEQTTYETTSQIGTTTVTTTTTTTTGMNTPTESHTASSEPSTELPTATGGSTITVRDIATGSTTAPRPLPQQGSATVGSSETASKTSQNVRTSTTACSLSSIATTAGTATNATADAADTTLHPGNVTDLLPTTSQGLSNISLGHTTLSSVGTERTRTVIRWGKEILHLMEKVKRGPLYAEVNEYGRIYPVTFGKSHCEIIDSSTGEDNFA